MKITAEISKQIYEIAIRPGNKLTNREIGEKFGIDEATVRYHIKKWENKLHQIAKTDEKTAAAISDITINCHNEVDQVIKNVKFSIQTARNNGVSPEKLAPLFNNWLKGLELAGELLGQLGRSPIVEIQFNELKAVVVGELCDDCKQKLKEKLYEIVSN